MQGLGGSLHSDLIEQAYRKTGLLVFGSTNWSQTPWLQAS
jgi:hypothetical protein